MHDKIVKILKVAQDNYRIADDILAMLEAKDNRMCLSSVEELVAGKVAEEKERCAGLVEDTISPHENWVDRDEVAAAIRAGPQHA